MMSEKELKPCPFCGSMKLKIDSKQRVAGCTGINAQVESMTYSVRCNVCHARGGTAGGLVIQGNLLAYIDSMPEWATTEDVLKDAAIELWNNRVQVWDREESKRAHGAKNKRIEEIVKIICPYRADDGKCTCNQHQFGVRKCADPCAHRDIAEQVVDAGYAPVVHGEWIESSVPGSMLSECSVCHFTCGAYTFKYCPMCGAKMDGGSE
jgi:hypothetical protein